jgi:hypothetical protein
MKSLPIALAALLLPGVIPGQRLQNGSIEGIVVKSGSADVRLQFSGTSTGAGFGNDDVASGVGEPLAGATVELTGISGDRIQSRTIKTGRDGKFGFRDIPPGEGYQIIAIHSPEYLPAQYGQRYPGLPGTPISIAAGEQLRDARIVMTRAGEVSGRVLDSGQPRSGVVVAMRPFYEEGRRVLGSMAYGKNGIVANIATNNKGEYRIGGLPAGQYYFCLSSTGQICTPAPTNLRAGDSLNGINIEFRSTDQQVLQAEVISRVSGRPLNSVRIGVVPMDSVPNPPSTPFRNSPSGFVTALRLGSYFIVAAANENGTPLFGYLPIKLRGNNLPPVQVVVEPSFNIQGQITGNGAANAKVRLQPMIQGMTDIPSAVVSSDGSFVLRGATPGEYRVIVSTPQTPNSYLQSIRFGGRDVPAAILQLATRANSRLEISLGSNAATVIGNVVRTSNGKTLPASGTRVVLIPDAARRDRRDLYKNVFTDNAGKFQLTGVAPGNYKLFAWELVEDGAWEDPEFMQIYEDAGKAVRVAENGREAVDINLIPPWN